MGGNRRGKFNLHAPCSRPYRCESLFQTQVDPHRMIYLSPAAETNIGNINIRDQHDRAFIGEQF